MKSILLALTSVALIPTSAIGQIEAVAAAPVVRAAAPGAVLRTGTELVLKTREELTTKHKALRVGQRFALEVAEPVIVQGVVVAPVGTPAVGEIVEVRNKGMWGKSGHFAAQLRYMTVNGRQIRLTGTFDDKGTAGGIPAVAASVLFLPAGFLISGTNAMIPVGTAVKGFIDEDIPLALPAAEAAPLVIPASPAPAQ